LLLSFSSRSWLWSLWFFFIWALIISNVFYLGGLNICHFGTLEIVPECNYHHIWHICTALFVLNRTRFNQVTCVNPSPIPVIKNPITETGFSPLFKTTAWKQIHAWNIYVQCDNICTSIVSEFLTRWRRIDNFNQ
jgi:hypothetical protein